MQATINILVIDDDEDLRDSLQIVLEREGYRVFAASDGAAGVEIYRAEQTDLVITDIIMPIKEGLETITELHREFPDVKIIAMSGGGRVGVKNYLDWAEGLGAHRVLAKPFSRSEILNSVKEVLGR